MNLCSRCGSNVYSEENATVSRILRIPDVLRARLKAWACTSYPHEACGLLIGRNVGACNAVVDVRQARNLRTERAHDRYEIDPQDFLAADRDARHRHLELVGVWHTHPDHPARPSSTDLAAAWPQWSYVILAVGQAGVSEMTSWRLADTAFEQEEIQS